MAEFPPEASVQKPIVIVEQLAKASYLTVLWGLPRSQIISYLPVPPRNCMHPNSVLTFVWCLWPQKAMRTKEYECFVLKIQRLENLCRALQEERNELYKKIKQAQFPEEVNGNGILEEGDDADRSPSSEQASIELRTNDERMLKELAEAFRVSHKAEESVPSNSSNPEASDAQTCNAILVPELPSPLTPQSEAGNCCEQPSMSTLAPTEHMPAPTGSTPAPTENMTTPTKNMTKLTKSMLVLPEGVPVPTESAPIPPKSVPVPTANMPKPTESMPATPENLPTPAQNMPLPLGNMPAPTISPPKAAECVDDPAEQSVQGQSSEQTGDTDMEAVDWRCWCVQACPLKTTTLLCPLNWYLFFFLKKQKVGTKPHISVGKVMQFSLLPLSSNNGSPNFAVFHLLEA